MFLGEDHKLGVLMRHGALRVGLAEQQRVLAEKLTRPCARDLDFTAVTDVEDPHAAREHDEERFRLGPRFEDDTTGAPAEVAGGTDQLKQCSVVDFREEWNTPQGSQKAMRDLVAHEVGCLS